MFIVLSNDGDWESDQFAVVGLINMSVITKRDCIDFVSKQRGKQFDTACPYLQGTEQCQQYIEDSEYTVWSEGEIDSILDVFDEHNITYVFVNATDLTILQ